MSKKKPMKVISLEIRNYMGIKAVEIRPGPGVVKIEGKNRAGKSSVIGAIWADIGGKDEIPPLPIRKGQTDARIRLDLGEIIVTRRFTEAGTYLEVTSGGLKYPSPQTMLDTLFSKVSMDPQAFIDLKPALRRELLLDLTGKRAELAVLENEQLEAYTERTLVNREIKDIKGKLAGALPEEAIEEISIPLIMQESQEAEQHNRGIDALQTNLDNEKGSVKSMEEQVAERAREIAELSDQISELEHEIAEANARRRELARSISKLTPIDTSGFKVKIAEAEEHNNRFRAIAAARELRQELDKKEALSRQFTKAVLGAETSRRDILSKSALPIKNLAIEGDHIVIEGTPFDNLSTSEQITVAMEIGMALNPTLRVLRISRGRELDAESMAAVEKFAEVSDCQVWIEYVTEESQGGFFIEDGEVKSADF